MPQTKKAAITVSDTRADVVIERLPEGERLYVGVDVGKGGHFAGLISSTFLLQYKRYSACPSFKFDNSREGFTLLLEKIRTLVPLSCVSILMERTGHYHKALEQYLLEEGIEVYLMQVHRRPDRLIKTDRRDSLGLGVHLYNLLERGIHPSETKQAVHRVTPPTEQIAKLQSLIRHHQRLTEEATQRKNQLTALCDELFPEFTSVWKDPNRDIPLAYRKMFPTPAAIASASIEELRVPKGTHRSPSDDRLQRLQSLAKQSIGSKKDGRVEGLSLIQSQLIAELQLIGEHSAVLEQEIGTIMQASREGQILLSTGIIGPIQAAMLLAGISNIANFASAAKLRAYCGWAPKQTQTGTTLDSIVLARAGRRDLRLTMYLIALSATRLDCEWADLYRRLVEKRCEWSEEKGKYVGKMKVIGRVAGQIITLIWTLLQQDSILLASLAPGETPPAPKLYDREVHHQHIEARGKKRKE